MLRIEYFDKERFTFRDRIFMQTEEKARFPGQHGKGAR